MVQAFFEYAWHLWLTLRKVNHRVPARWGNLASAEKALVETLEAKGYIK